MAAKLIAHSAADVLPMMDGASYDAFKADIATHGQREPIVLHEGRIVDGRNRYRACRELGIEPTTTEWDGKGSLVSFIVSVNLHRRDLSASQKAMAAAEFLPMLESEAKQRQRDSGGDKKSESAKSVSQRIEQPIANEKKATHQAAKLTGTNRQYVSDAKSIKEKAPEIAAKVKSGELTLPQARNAIKKEERRHELTAKAKAAPKQPDWEIIEGDCVRTFKTLDDRSARLIFADPPYNIGIDYGDGAKADSLDDAAYMRWVASWLEECWRVLKDDGSLWVMIGDEYAAEYAVALKKIGFTIRSWVKWYETFGVNCANNFNRTSRHIFYCVANPKRFVFNTEAVSRPSDRQLKYADKRADPSGKIWDDVWQISRVTGTSSERMPDFPTQLPLAITRAIVGCASDPGDLVIDPFNGSGSTGVAAIELGRKYLGMEKSSEYCQAARLRLHGIQQQESVQ